MHTLTHTHTHNVHTYTHTHSAHIHAHTQAHANTPRCTRTCTYTHMHTYTHKRTHINNLHYSFTNLVYLTKDTQHPDRLLTTDATSRQHKTYSRLSLNATHTHTHTHIINMHTVVHRARTSYHLVIYINKATKVHKPFSKLILNHTEKIVYSTCQLYL